VKPAIPLLKTTLQLTIHTTAKTAVYYLAKDFEKDHLH
jgi:hypothetical protein